MEKNHLNEHPLGEQPGSPAEVERKGLRIRETQFRTSQRFRVCQATGNLDSSRVAAPISPSRTKLKEYISKGRVKFRPHVKPKQPPAADFGLASPRVAGNVLSEQTRAVSAGLGARFALGSAAARALQQETFCPVFGLPVSTLAESRNNFFDSPEKKHDK